MLHQQGVDIISFKVAVDSKWLHLHGHSLLQSEQGQACQPQLSSDSHHRRVQEGPHPPGEDDQGCHYYHLRREDDSETPPDVPRKRGPALEYQEFFEAGIGREERPESVQATVSEGRPLHH